VSEAFFLKWERRRIRYWLLQKEHLEFPKKLFRRGKRGKQLFLVTRMG